MPLSMTITDVPMLVAMEEIDIVRINELFQDVDISHVPDMLSGLDYTEAAHSLHEIINARHHQTAHAGRPATHVKFPSLVRVATDFVRDHGFAAHERRRDTTGSVGVSLRQIQEHCFSTIPGLREHGLSLNTVHRLFSAPNNRTASKKKYKDLVPARIAHKANCLSTGHEDSHYCRAQVKMALELIKHFGDEVLGLSADAKAKFGMSGAAVSRMVRPNSFMLSSDRIQLPDHDFPEPGYKISPMGYMLLQPTDSGQLPRTGPLTLYLRSHMFNKESAASHSNDLMDCLRPVVDASEKKAVVMVVDNGPDWCRHSVKTVLAMGRVWEHLDLDYLLLTSYAPGDSKFNPIEHAWAPITRWCSGLVLHNSLEGESTCPNKQNISQEQKDEKNKVVFSVALKKLESVLNGREFDGHAITVKTVTVGEDACDDVAGVLSRIATRKAIDEATDEVKEAADKLKFLASHSRQGTYTLEFMRCEEQDCEHCSRKPAVAVKTLDIVRNGGMFVPRLSEERPGHFSTFSEELSLRESGTPPVELDSLLPSKRGIIKRCTSVNCFKVFQSVADMKRHMLLCH